MKKIVLILSLFLSANVFADLVEDGNKAYEYEQYEKAVELYKKACNTGSSDGCLYTAKMYEEDDSIYKKRGIKANLKESKIYYKRAADLYCDSWREEPHLAFSIIERYMDKEKSKNFFIKLCNDNIGVGCFYLAKKETGEKMAELYMKACDNGYPKGCYELARKQNRDKNKYPTKKILKKGCTLGSKSACMRLGRIFKVNKDYSNALKYISKACDMNGSGACYKMSYIYRDGKYGIDKNLTIAKIFCDKAESLGMVNVCGSVLNKEILLLKEAQKGKNYGN